MLNKSGFTTIKLMVVLTILVIVPCLIIGLPHLAIWAVNTLVKEAGVTNFTIAHSWKAWLGILVLLGRIGGTKGSYTKQK